MEREGRAYHRRRPDQTGEPPAGDRHRELLDRLEAAVSAIQDSDSFRRYLDAQARFHRYSWRNVALILAQRPAATQVAGYRTWQSLGRQVRRGERGIAIAVPLPTRIQTDDGEDAQVLLRFGIGTVFDIVQTDGDPLPEVPVPVLEDDAGGDLYGALGQLAQAEGITLDHQTQLVSPEAMGSYDPQRRRIVVREASQLQMTKTLAHELAHVRHGTGTIATHRRWDRSGRIPVGHPTYFAAKANGDQSMSGTRETPEDVYGRQDPQDLRDMVKARLPELQFPAGVKFCPPLPRLLRSHHQPPHGVPGGDLPSGDAMDNESI